MISPIDPTVNEEADIALINHAQPTKNTGKKFTGVNLMLCSQ
ncbi:hypothetical protein P7D83_07970 [Enterococcus dongliensis]|nr:hypothetical protein [Enterococcus dongliensis]